MECSGWGVRCTHLVAGPWLVVFQIEAVCVRIVCAIRTYIGMQAASVAGLERAGLPCMLIGSEAG